MVFDFSKLRGRIIERFGSSAAFATAVGLPESSISARLNNRVKISSVEIMRWSQPDLLDIPIKDVHVYFLTPKVR